MTESTRRAVGARTRRARPLKAALGLTCLMVATLLVAVTASASPSADPAGVGSPATSDGGDLKPEPDTEVPEDLRQGSLGAGVTQNAGAIIGDPNCALETLPANDDGSTDEILLPFSIDFFGDSFSSLYVNNNGNVTFDAPLGAFTPTNLLQTGAKMIAPFWADVDTRGTFVEGIDAADGVVAEASPPGFGSAEVTYGTTIHEGHLALCVNWVDVGYYANHVDKLNSFQLLLVDRSDVDAGDVDVVFNYGSILWETGDASGGDNGFGGSPARAGFAGGVGAGALAATGYEIPGSGTTGAFLDGALDPLSQRSVNSAVPGRQVYEFRSGNPGFEGASGQITDTLGPVARTMVAVLDTADFSLAGGAVTDASGYFNAIVPPGDYFLYLIDPTGGHAIGFAGAPDTVTVEPGLFTYTEPTMTALRGGVNGTISSSDTLDGIPGAVAVLIDLTISGPGRGVIADDFGNFNIPDLPVGNYLAVFLDPTAAHLSEFHDDSPGPGGAQVFAVTAGASTSLFPELAAAPNVNAQGGAELSGTITDEVSGQPLDNVMVAALHASTYGLAQATFTDAAGAYALDLDPGDYKLEFVDLDGRHTMEWYDDLPGDGIGSAVTVTAPGTADAALPPRTGAIAGTVTDDPSTAPLPGSWVLAIGNTGITSGDVTLSDGAYTLDGLAPGAYHVTFVDPNGGRAQEFWDDSLDFGGASPIVVTVGNTTSPIDAALHL